MKTLMTYAQNIVGLHYLRAPGELTNGDFVKIIFGALVVGLLPLLPNYK